MLKKTITYTDYNDNERTETFYFHLSEAELTEWYASETGGMDAVIQRIVAEEDIKNIIALFKELICRAYGVKSFDGRTFNKEPEALKAFVDSPAYSILFMELATDADSAADFCKKILPKKVNSAPNTLSSPKSN